MKTDQIALDFSIHNPPPEGSKDLGLWVYYHFLLAYHEKERLGLPQRYKESYQMFRGDHWGISGVKDSISVNLFFANVQRTIANITARNPVVEVIDTDGIQDQGDAMLSASVDKWWHETEQQSSLGLTAQANENYGIAIEKAVKIPGKKKSDSILIDPFSFFPAPGYYKDLQDYPFIIHAFSQHVDKVKKDFEVDEVQPDPIEAFLGMTAREGLRPNASTLQRSQVYGNSDMLLRTGTTSPNATIGSDQNCLVIEMWFRDDTLVKKEVEVIVVDPDTGEESIEIEEYEGYKYPDRIRTVTVTNFGNVVLLDDKNSNLNFEFPEEQIRETYAWGRYPFSKINSYEDTISLWGFSASEQVGGLQKKIDEIVTKMVAYVKRAMFPPLIIDKGCGITKDMVNNKPGLVLFPTRPNARIEFIQLPNLPESFFRVLDILITLHDRIYQIEDADRGVAPKGVIAAAAIYALQERNAVLIQHKIRALEYITRERGRWRISMLQNFGSKYNRVEVNGDPVEFIPQHFIGRKFNFRVEAGSTVAKTSLQEQEQAMTLYDKKAIDRRALLEILKITGWKQILERMGEDELTFHLQGLIEAGLSEQGAIILKQYLLEKQANLSEQQKQEQEAPALKSIAGAAERPRV